MPPHDPSSSPEKIERLKRVMYSRSLSKHLQEHERHALKPERAPVPDDWVRPEKTMSPVTAAPRSLSTMRTLVRFVVGASLAFFIGAAGFFGYYFLIGAGASPVSPGNIDISVSGPLQVASGEPVQLQIAIYNRNRTTLQLADLVVKYPAGTRSPTDLVTDLPSQRITLGEIEPGGRRQGTVSAVVAGREGEQATVTVELEYRLENSSAIFVATSQYQLSFVSSPLSISVEGNQEVISGQPVEFVVTVASNADTPVKDVLFSAGFPFGFEVVSADPKMLTTEGSNLWSLGDIAPGTKRQIRLRGTLSGASGDERVFRFTSGARKNKEETSMSVVFADYAHHVVVSRPFLDLAIRVNRDTGAPVVGPGETVQVSVEWQNNLQTQITNAVVVARLSGVEIDGTTVRSTDGFYRSVDRTVLWDKSTTNGALATLTPGSRGTLNFSFQVPNDEVMKALRDPKLTISIHAAGERVSEVNVPETLQSTASQTLRFASDLQVVAQGLYYSNPFGSTGPIPPQAGVETTYAIVFSITNTTNAINNGRLVATLPPYVRWVGIYSPSQEKLVFNPNDSTVTWNIGTIAAGAGVSGATPRQAAIAIGFTPSTSQIGQQPVLIRAISLSGVDASNNAPVTKTTPDVTTNIAGDPGFSSANATVVK